MHYILHEKPPLGQESVTNSCTGKKHILQPKKGLFSPSLDVRGIKLQSILKSFHGSLFKKLSNSNKGSVPLFPNSYCYSNANWTYGKEGNEVGSAPFIFPQLTVVRVTQRW